MFGFMFPALSSTYARPSMTSADVRLIAEESNANLTQRVQLLELACAGLWELLKSQHGFSDEQLLEKIHEVDARDGQVDNQIGHAAQVCPHCNRKLLTRNPTKCAWCGGALNSTVF